MTHIQRAKRNNDTRDAMLFQMLIDAAELMGEKRKTACITCTLNKYVK